MNFRNLAVLLAVSFSVLCSSSAQDKPPPFPYLEGTIGCGSSTTSFFAGSATSWDPDPSVAVSNAYQALLTKMTTFQGSDGITYRICGLCFPLIYTNCPATVTTHDPVSYTLTQITGTGFWRCTATYMGFYDLDCEDTCDDDE